MQAMIRSIMAVAILLSAPNMVSAQDKAGEFDYYLLSLSWSPNWCAREGEDRGAAQCQPGNALGWTLHGLWPQYEDGWPSFCSTRKRAPTRAQTADMADIMGSAGLAWHQWNKHGRCTGLTAADYYALSRSAFERITIPESFRKLTSPIRLPAAVVEEAFLVENPGLSADMLTVTCKGKQIQEVRICLDKSLVPRSCAPDVARDCSLTRAFMEPVR